MSRPNIVVVVPDQLRADALGCFGNQVALTPNVDDLASRGVRFTQAFGQHPFCTQSRTSFLTGWYPHVHGNRTLAQVLPAGTPNVLGVLRSAGYHVAHVGIRGDTFEPGQTRHNTSRYGFTVLPEIGPGESPFPPGHRLRHSFYVGRRDDRIDFDEACVRTAEDWLGDGLPEPWLLYVPLIAPHPPFEVPEPWFSLHDRADMALPIPPTAGGPMFRGLLHDRYGLGRLGDDDWREIVATYQGMVSRMDHHLGRILSAVARTGAEGRTVTVVFPDHGEYLGDFGLVEKWISGVEPCLVHNPLLVADPRRPAGVCDELVELVDIPPTLYELAEVEPGYEHFGRSLGPLLGATAVAHRDAAFTEGGLSPDEAARSGGEPFPYDVKHDTERDVPRAAGRVTAMRTQDWTYVHRVAEPAELYHRPTDPRETVDVIADPRHAEVVAHLREQMLTWLASTSDVAGPAFDRMDLDGARLGRS